MTILFPKPRVRVLDAHLLPAHIISAIQNMADEYSVCALIIMNAPHIGVVRTYQDSDGYITLKCFQYREEHQV